MNSRYIYFIIIYICSLKKKRLNLSCVVSTKLQYLTICALNHSLFLPSLKQKKKKKTDNVGIWRRNSLTEGPAEHTMFLSYTAVIGFEGRNMIDGNRGEIIWKKIKSKNK